MTLITFLRTLAKFYRNSQLNHAQLKLSEDCIYKNMWFQTSFSQYQTALDKVRYFISFKSNIHNMNEYY
jgi:hypothetical protein